MEDHLKANSKGKGGGKPGLIETPEELLRRMRISFLASCILVMIFAVSYGFLEYYYINDPVLGKTANLTVQGGSHRVAAPIIGGLYSYHLFPMMLIFVLTGFYPFFDSISFNILGRHKREKTVDLGIASVLSAVLVEDFSWFFYRWWLPLDNDPKRYLLMQTSDWTARTLGGLPVHALGIFGSFVIPYWYFVAIALAGIFYYAAFRKPR